MRRKLAVVLTGLSLLFVSGAWAQKPPACEDVAVRITLSAHISGATVSRIYGDSGNATADTVYEDGVGGVYAKFQICNGTNDLIINLNQARGRHFLFDFSDVLAPPQPGTLAPPAGPVQVTFSNFNQAYETPVGGTLGVSHATTVKLSSKVTDLFRFSNPAAEGWPGPNPQLTAINTPIDTSLVIVSHPDCATWFFSPDTSTSSRAGLAQQMKNGSYVSGGQYSMPYTMKVERLGACPAP